MDIPNGRNGTNRCRPPSIEGSNLLWAADHALDGCCEFEKLSLNMAKFTIPLDENGNILSPVGEVLASRRIALIEDEELIHPCRALSTGWSKLERSLLSAVKALLASDFQDSNDEGSAPGLLIAFEDLCYTATELFDVYAAYIPKAINLRPDRTFKASEEAYRKVTKNHRAEWALICNRLKHNYNVLVPVMQKSIQTGQEIRGFALFQPTGKDGLSHSSDLHKTDLSRPFDLSFKQLIHDLLRCEVAAADVIGTLPETASIAASSSRMTYHVGAALRTISLRTVFSGDKQPTLFDGYEIHGRALSLSRQRAVILSGRKEVSAKFRADGFTRTFSLV
jgi:hypothetical protein